MYFFLICNQLQLISNEILMNTFNYIQLVVVPEFFILILIDKINKENLNFVETYIEVEKFLNKILRIW